MFSTTDGGVVSGIEATLTGPPTISMSCDGYRCSYYGEEAAGGYTLHVSAPGFEAASVPATIRVTALQCGVYATLEPGRLVINPSEDSLCLLRSSQLNALGAIGIPHFCLIISRVNAERILDVQARTCTLPHETFPDRSLALGGYLT